MLKKVITQAKRNEIETQIIECDNKSKAVWQIINKHINNKQVHETKNFKLQLENETITEDPKLISEIFNKYYTNIATSLTKHLDISQNSHRNLLRNTNLSPKDSIVLRPTTTEELIQIVNKFKNKSSFGIDEIPITVIKNA